MHKQKQNFLFRLLCYCILSFACLCVFSETVEAADVRIALLVGNQYGWKGDPALRYVVKGDLLPMKRALKRLGFKTYAVLANQDPEALRTVFRRLIKRVKQKPKVTTFFFYYSGHASKDFFHMGPKAEKPFSYREFVGFLNRLEVKRRFSIIDACFSGEVIRQFGNLQQYRNLLRKGQLPKGVAKKLNRRDLVRHLPNSGEQVRGLQILSSSRALSFESLEHKASVFTFHILRGLQGAADLDRDGKVSFNELFLYAKPRVFRETGQRPQQWLFRVGGEAYSFAPVYRGKVAIEANLIGQLFIQIGNFHWTFRKLQKEELLLAMVTGHGKVYWKRSNRCLFKEIMIKPTFLLKLKANEGWTSVKCPKSQVASKSGIELPYSKALPPDDSLWELEVLGGMWASNGALQRSGDFSGLGAIGLRSQWLGLFLQLWGSSLTFQKGSYFQLGIELRPEFGYRGRWGSWDLFAGAYFSFGLLLQDLNFEPKPAFLLRTGLTVSPSIWITSKLALVLSFDAGIHPVFGLQKTELAGIFRAVLGLRFGL